MQCDARGSEVTVAVGVAVIIVLAVKMGYYYSKTRNGKRAGRRAFLISMSVPARSRELGKTVLDAWLPDGVWLRRAVLLNG